MPSSVRSTSDVIRLVTAGADDLLIGAPWSLRQQVRDAVTEDLADIPAAFAVLPGSPVHTINDITTDLLDLVVTTLLDRLR